MRVQIKIGEYTDTFDLRDDLVSTEGERFDLPVAGHSADNQVISAYRRLYRIVVWKEYLNVMEGIPDD
jgi:hypothetical protein